MPVEESFSEVWLTPSGQEVTLVFYWVVDSWHIYQHTPPLITNYLPTQGHDWPDIRSATDFLTNSGHRRPDAS